MALRHEDFLGSQSWVTQQHVVESDEHAAITVGREFTCRTRDPSSTEVLNPFDAIAGKKLKTTLDENFFGERVTDLDGWTFSRTTFGKSIRGENRGSADAITTRPCPEQHHEVTDALCVREV